METFFLFQTVVLVLTNFWSKRITFMHPAILAIFFANWFFINVVQPVFLNNFFCNWWSKTNRINILQYVVPYKILQLVGPDKLFATSRSGYIAFADCCCVDNWSSMLNWHSSVEIFWKTASNVALSRQDPWARQLARRYRALHPPRHGLSLSGFLSLNLSDLLLRKNRMEGMKSEIREMLKGIER